MPTYIKKIYNVQPFARNHIMPLEQPISGMPLPAPGDEGEQDNGDASVFEHAADYTSRT
jgi:hypothetical protein